MSLTRSKVKVKITGLLNFRQLAKPCMHAGGDDRSPLAGLSGLVCVRITFVVNVIIVYPMVSRTQLKLQLHLSSIKL